MKQDIQSKRDIELLVDLFYEKVKKDLVLSKYFQGMDWSKHLPTMYKFWENVVFYTGRYNGNPMQVHYGLHQRMPLGLGDFQQWLYLFSETVDELYEGENANNIKQRAQNIATVMQIKILK